MDADFSHDPAHLPTMIEAARDADLVLGSRYVPGGAGAQLGRGAPPREPRRMLVRARSCSGSSVRDLTGGFKCFRREVLEAIDLESVRSQGYAFQVELTYRALQRGLPGAGGPDRVHGPAGRQEQDVAPDRAGGDVDGAAAEGRPTALHQMKCGASRLVRTGF